MTEEKEDSCASRLIRRRRRSSCHEGSAIVVPELDRRQNRLLWAEFELPNPDLPSSYPSPCSLSSSFIMGRVLLKVCYIILQPMYPG